MNSRAILGISLAIAFVLSAVLIPAFAGGHLVLTKTEVKVKNDLLKAKQKVDVKIKASAPIPTTGPSAFGYGILSDGTDNVVALTTHPGVLDHSSQGGVASNPIFHAHVLDLAVAGTITDPCPLQPPGPPVPGTFEFVVDFASSTGTAPPGTPNNIDAKYKVKVDKNTITVKKIPVSPATGDMNDNTVEAIVAFAIDGSLGANPLTPGGAVPVELAKSTTNSNVPGTGGPGG